MTFDRTSAETVVDYVILINILFSRTSKRSEFIFTSKYVEKHFTKPEIYHSAKERVLDSLALVFDEAEQDAKKAINTDLNYVHEHIHNCKGYLPTNCHWNKRTANDELGGFLSECFYYRSSEEQEKLPEKDYRNDYLPEILNCCYESLVSQQPFQHLLQLRPQLTITYPDSHIDDVDTPEQAAALVSHYCQLIRDELDKERPSENRIQELLLNRAEPLARLADNFSSIEQVVKLLATTPERIAPDNIKHRLWSDCSVSMYSLKEDYAPISGTEQLLEMLKKYKNHLYTRERAIKKGKNVESMIKRVKEIESKIVSLKEGQDRGFLAFTYSQLGNEYYRISQNSLDEYPWLKKSRDAFKEALEIANYGKGPAAWAWPIMFILKLRAQFALRPDHPKILTTHPIDWLRLLHAKSLLMQTSNSFGSDNSGKMITVRKVLAGKSGWGFAPIPDADGGQTIEEFDLRLNH